MIEGADHRIAASANQCAHEEGRAHRCPAAPDQALAFEYAAVAGQRGDPDESRELFARQRTELREFTDQGATEDGADAGRGAQQILLGAPHRTGLDGAIQIPINIVELAFGASGYAG